MGGGAGGGQRLGMLVRVFTILVLAYPHFSLTTTGVAIGRDQGRAPGSRGRRERGATDVVGRQCGGVPDCALHPTRLLLQRGPRECRGVYQGLHYAGENGERTGEVQGGDKEDEK